MNKTEFLKAVAEKAELSGKQAQNAYDAIMEVIAETLKKGEKIQIPGFGSFELVSKPATTIG